MAGHLKNFEIHIFLNIAIDMNVDTFCESYNIFYCISHNQVFLKFCISSIKNIWARCWHLSYSSILRIFQIFLLLYYILFELAIGPFVVPRDSLFTHGFK